MVIVIYYLILCFATIVGCLKYKTLTINFKLLTIILIVTSIDEIVAYCLDHTIQEDITAPYHFFQIIEYALVALIYRNIIISKIIKTYISYSLFLYPIIMLLFSWFVQPLSTYPSYSLMLSYGTITIYTLVVYYEFIVYYELNYFKNATFWLNTLFFLLCFICFFTLSVTNIFKIDTQNNEPVYYMHILVNYCFYIGCLLLFIYSKSNSKNQIAS